ncbi:MAG: AAA family ATPase, partial [Succinivibrio sp.]|nr:AAA family ATPase [Succinivibrio sp.]
MKKIKFLTGCENFSRIIEDNAYYVDKTAYLKTLFMSSSEVLNSLFIRPRRFGKTLTMSMIKEFCELNYQNPGDKSYQHKFFIDNGRNFAVAGDEYKELRDKVMGEYPVISISFKGVEGRTFSSAVFSMLGIVSELYERFLFLRESSRQSVENKNRFSYIYGFSTNQAYQLNEPGNMEKAVDVCSAFISTLALMLYRESGRMIQLLIDAYDVPLQKA